MTDKVFNDKKRYLARVEAELDKHITDLSQQFLKVVIEQFIDQLDRDGDTIKNTPKNIRIIATIDRLFTQFMDRNGGGIAKRIADGADKILKLNTDYFGKFADSEAQFKASTDKIREIIGNRLGIGERYKLVPGGYMDTLLKDNDVRTRIKDLAFREVSKGSGFTSFRKGLQKLIVGDQERMGAFKQHYRNYAYDAFVQVDREQSLIMAKDLGLQYFIYQGTVIESSREFCIKRVGKVFTIEEAMEWKNDPWIKRALERGYITSYDPTKDMGLWGCRHIAQFVPKNVAEAMRSDLKVVKGPKQKLVPDGKAIQSQFTKIDSDVERQFSAATSAIDRVHGDGDLKDIPIISKNMKSSAVFSYSAKDSDPIYIALSTKTKKHSEFALIHEMGHFLDNYSIGARGGFESEKKDGLLSEVISAAEKSESITGIKAILKKRSFTKDGKEEKLTPAEIEYFRYLVKPKEIWARAYTQFIAKRSGSDAVQEGVEKFFAGEEKYGIKIQWESSDFEEIERQIEEFMLNEKWMKRPNQ